MDLNNGYLSWVSKFVFDLCLNKIWRVESNTMTTIKAFLRNFVSKKCQIIWINLKFTVEGLLDLALVIRNILNFALYDSFILFDSTLFLVVFILHSHFLDCQIMLENYLTFFLISLLCRAGLWSWILRYFL
jgi:hypothetical protein